MSRRPPSTINVVPVMKRASGAARKQIAAAMSSGLPNCSLDFLYAILDIQVIPKHRGVDSSGRNAINAYLPRRNLSLNPRVNASMPPLEVA